MHRPISSWYLSPTPVPSHPYRRPQKQQTVPTMLPQPPSTLPQGFECSGTVTGLGSEVEGLKVGDRVLAVTLFGAYSSRLVAPAHQVRTRSQRHQHRSSDGSAGSGSKSSLDRFCWRSSRFNTCFRIRVTSEGSMDGIASRVCASGVATAMATSRLGCSVSSGGVEYPDGTSWDGGPGPSAGTNGRRMPHPLHLVRNSGGPLDCRDPL